MARVVVDGEALKECFSRLFNLALETNVYVKGMMLGNDIEGGCWSWRRNLLVWEVELLEKCKVLLSNIICRIMWRRIEFGILTPRWFVLC